MLTITETASDNFKQILKENPGKSVRIIFEGFGWGGPSLGLTLEESDEKEQTIDINGIELLIAEHVLPYTKGQKIDYISNPHGQGFAILPISGGC